jgi:hypothetical protein
MIAGMLDLCYNPKAVNSRRYYNHVLLYVWRT